MSSEASEDRKRRCHYEVLGVSRDCSPEEIRSAYRKLALQLHPDKVAAQSPGGIVSAAVTTAFQDLLHAYETLSDPQARAYYDSHRSQILFSDPTTTSGNNSFFDLDLFSFFSPSAYSGFSDVGRGFYKVYGDVFGKIYEKEVFYLKEMGLALDSIRPSPLFGNAESPYDQVSAFYAYWFGFCTVLDFGWVDKYDAAAGENRRARRLMEEENKKLRKKAKKEYNENVRALAAFSKKKDKRVIIYAAKKKEEEEKRRLEEKKRKEEEERKKMERIRNYEDQEWVKVNVEEEHDDDVDGFSHDDCSSNSNSNKYKKKDDNCGGSSELYCVICSKKFKSEKQWKNHEQSRKHKDKVAELRQTILDDEGRNDDGDEEPTLHGEIQVEPHVSLGNIPKDGKNDSLVDKLCEEFENGLRSQVDNDESLTLEDTDEKLEHDDEEDFLEAMLSGHKSRMAMNSDQFDASNSRTCHIDGEQESYMDYVNQKKGRKSQRRVNKGKVDANNEDDLKGDKQDGEIGVQVVKAQNVDESTSHSVQEPDAKRREDDNPGKHQKPKNHARVNGAGKKVNDLKSRNSSKGKKQKGGSKACGNECATCGESFDSRNKLFAHLGHTGHAMLRLR